MKPFCLEEAKAGKPVCTRDGRPVRILCLDAKNDRYPIVALVDDDGEEGAYLYDKNGCFFTKKDSINDLMMAGEKHTGWINIYSNGLCYSTSTCIHKTEEIAKLRADSKHVIATIKIEWED